MKLTGNLHLICIKNLGDKAKLPQASLYPLNVVPVGKRTVVRTILNINEDQSMTLAGDVPMNSRVQLMMASVDGICSSAHCSRIYHEKQKKDTRNCNIGRVALVEN
jgi:hypothetical protein